MACAELKRVVNWKTASAYAGASSNGAINDHQADKGSASARAPGWGTNGFKQELAEKAAALAAGSVEGAPGSFIAGVDHLAWINLDLHNECSGPYLARAFALCCQHYERRRLNDGMSH